MDPVEETFYYRLFVYLLIERFLPMIALSIAFFLGAAVTILICVFTSPGLLK